MISQSKKAVSPERLKELKQKLKNHLFSHTPKQIAAQKARTEIRNKFWIDSWHRGLYYRAFLVGNIPFLPEKDLNYFKATEGNVVLIAVSGLRSILLACQLGHLAKVPRIILIDTSAQVSILWKNLKTIALKNHEATGFLKELESFILKYGILFKNLDAQKAVCFFQEMIFKNYPYENYVREIILRALVYKQNWGSKPTMQKIKNLITLWEIPKKNVFAFPSDIVAYAEKTEALEKSQEILENIAFLDPAVAIHATMKEDNRIDQAYFITDHRSEFLMRLLLKPPTCRIL